MPAHATETLRGLLAVPVTTAEPDPLIGAWAVTDTALPDVTEPSLPLALVNTGGAGQVAGPLGLAVRRGLPLASMTTTVADPMDPAGNVRRIVAAVDAARDEGVLTEATAVRVVLPPEPVGPTWEAAADELAAVQFEAALPTVRGDVPVPSEVVVGWIDALLDRETSFAALDVGTASGVLGVLAATAAAWDGHGAEAAQRAFAAGDAGPAEVTTGRRWCRAIHLTDGATVAAVRDAFEG